MAPPRSRNFGFSRRARLGLFTSYVVAVGGIVAALVMLILANLYPASYNSVIGFITDCTSPWPRLGHGIVSFFDNTRENIASYVNAGSENIRLKKALEQRQSDLVKLQLLKSDNGKLKRLLSLVDHTPEKIAVGHIIGSPLAISNRRTAIIDVGSSLGVESGMPVLAAEGLVGRVLATGHFSARILLLIDPSNTLPVKIARSGVAALASGRGDGPLDVRPLIAGQSPFQKGDLLVTSGTGGIYPPDIPVAFVTALNNDGAIALPVVNPASVDYIMVEKIFEPDAPPEPSLADKTPSQKLSRKKTSKNNPTAKAVTQPLAGKTADNSVDSNSALPAVNKSR